jgi:hypothetical protein
MTRAPVTLASLAFGWGDAYLFSYARDRWVALRRDSPRFLTAGTLPGLEKAIEADYRDHPVPRDYDPPGATGYLSLPGDSVPDEETRFLLAALRCAFPAWTITYSDQTRAWLAQTRKKTICENSPVLLCAALLLIERRQGQGQGRPGPVLPPLPRGEPES